MEELTIEDFIGGLKVCHTDYNYISLSLKEHNSLTPHGRFLLDKKDAKRLGEWLIKSSEEQ